MTQRWRLINGSALYDMDNDREQRNDVADAHPDVVAALRREYEDWWEIVSEQFDVEIPIVLKADRSEVVLTAHDWRNEDCSSAWHQGLIRQGMVTSGYWEIEAAEAGHYEVELRRWPKETNYSVTAGIEGDDIVWRKDVIDEKDWRYYTGGKALPIKHARLKIGKLEVEQDIQDDDLYAIFHVSLPAGPAHLQAWFSDGLDYEVGVYYVYIRKME